mmetsp:Transcript_50324/g.140488  ORF Transcript_50324/g.140488 Transcript_50324/m.140488 type:complete len:334 (+) Transcript_50324:304-1305(+)
MSSKTTASTRGTANLVFDTNCCFVIFFLTCAVCTSALSITIANNVRYAESSSGKEPGLASQYAFANASTMRSICCDSRGRHKCCDISRKAWSKVTPCNSKQLKNCCEHALTKPSVVSLLPKNSPIATGLSPGSDVRTRTTTAGSRTGDDDGKSSKCSAMTLSSAIRCFADVSGELNVNTASEIIKCLRRLGDESTSVENSSKLRTPSPSRSALSKIASTTASGDAGSCNSTIAVRLRMTDTWLFNASLSSLFDKELSLSASRAWNMNSIFCWRPPRSSTESPRTNSRKSIVPSWFRSSAVRIDSTNALSSPAMVSDTSLKYNITSSLEAVPPG